MITVLLALINAKYKAGYETLFVATIFIDMLILTLIEELIK